MISQHRDDVEIMRPNCIGTIIYKVSNRKAWDAFGPGPQALAPTGDAALNDVDSMLDASQRGAGTGCERPGEALCCRVIAATSHNRLRERHLREPETFSEISITGVDSRSPVSILGDSEAARGRKPTASQLNWHGQTPKER